MLSPMTLALVTALTAVAPPAGQSTTDAPQKIALAYLKALDGSSSGDARSYLLGGVTLDAELASVPNWKIKSRDPVKVEQGDLASAVREMKKLDAIGRRTLDKILNAGGGESFASMTQKQAERIMKPTQDQAERFKKKHALFATMARVDREVYWHPKNPWRALLGKLGREGRYRLEFHRFHIQETDHGKTRVWPLRVLRMQTDTFDSGYKILPASDWDPSS